MRRGRGCWAERLKEADLDVGVAVFVLACCLATAALGVTGGIGGFDSGRRAPTSPATPVPGHPHDARPAACGAPGATRCHAHNVPFA